MIIIGFWRTKFLGFSPLTFFHLKKKGREKESFSFRDAHWSAERQDMMCEICFKIIQGAGVGNIGGTDETRFGQQLISVEFQWFYYSVLYMFKEVHNKGVGVKNIYQIGNTILSLRSREGQGEVKKEK